MVLLSGAVCSSNKPAVGRFTEMLLWCLVKVMLYFDHTITDGVFPKLEYFQTVDLVFLVIEEKTVIAFLSPIS